MNNKDLRVIKSKKNIRTAFLELMAEKGYQSITVKDIAERAFINRKTFYFHYETKEDLYNEIADEVSKIIRPTELLNNIMISPRERQRQIISHFLIEIKKNKDLFSVFLDDNSNPGFSNKIKKELFDALLTEVKIPTDSKNNPFTYEFLSESYFTIFKLLLKWWISVDTDDTNIVIDYLLRFFSKEPLELLGLKY
jgi:hypothetical protein